MQFEPLQRHLPEQPPQPGDLVEVRSRRWIVEGVEGGEAGVSPIVRLACADDDAQGMTLEVIWDLEPDRAILQAEGWERLAQRGFDPPKHFGAYFHTVRWNAVTATDPDLLQAPFRAGIHLDAYQMEPLRKALRLPRVTLFIADDTGLGKTIEAGLIARELLLRRKVRSIVVATPPSLLGQWRAEMGERFGLDFVILDRRYVARVRRARGFGANPWRTHSRFLVSHRLLADPAYADPLREWLGPFAPGSLFILDEAHHAAPASGQRYGIETKFTRAVRDLAHRFEHRLFLSATPHNGHSSSFSALMEMLDPHRFTRGVPVRPADLEPVMVRRLKTDLRALQGGFPERKVVRIPIRDLPDDAPELVLSRLLADYADARRERLRGAPPRAQAHDRLLLVGLQQRLLSSIEAFARSLARHRAAAERRWRHETASEAPPLEATAERFAAPPDADDDRAALPPPDADAEDAAEVEAATALAERAAPATARLVDRERALLDAMQRVAERARREPCAKARYLIDWIRDHLVPDLPAYGERPPGEPPRWLDRRVLIFTENREGTKRYLREVLETAIRYTDRADERLAVIDGLTSQERRDEIQRRFNAPPHEDPLRILLATDAAREGLNFQAHCADLFHFDLPWNPARIEQRNGRIDRRLQPAAEVRCHYFVLEQRPEDHVLEVLVRKTETIRRELGSLAPVIDDAVERLLRERGDRLRREAHTLAAHIDALDVDEARRRAVEAELEAARRRREDLEREIQRCRRLLDRSRRAIAFREAAFRAALDASLEMAGAHPLEPAPRVAGVDAWRVPGLDRLAATDPSWNATLDALRRPRRPDEKLAQWRRSAPLRPVVFRDPGVLTDDAVQLHLEHRIAQRLLARFVAQGFVYHDLARACLLVSGDSAPPRVALIGRLSLYGRRAERLHEQLVVVAANWLAPEQRGARGVRLRPFAEGGRAHDHLLDQLEHALDPDAPREPPPAVRSRLLETAAEDVEALLGVLHERARRAAARARERLAELGERHAAALARTLAEQRQRIEAELAKPFSPGLFEAQAERRTYEANRRAWQRLLDRFDAELAREPARIRASYEIHAERIEPVGLVYLWPETN